jgi:proteasome lid subunit RPN8/RPN11
MSYLTHDDQGLHQPRMVGRVRPIEVPLLRGLPDPDEYHEHIAADGRRVFVAKQVLRELDELERREHPVETAGLLLGGYFSDGRHPCTVVVKLAEPLLGDVVGTRSSVTITPAGAESMLRRAAQENPVLVPVGWAHTHPSFEAYFSGVDRAEQRAWRSAGSVGLVLSGLQHAHPRYRVFVGPDSTGAERRLPFALSAASQDADVKARGEDTATRELPTRQQNRASRRIRSGWAMLCRDHRRDLRRSSRRRHNAPSHRREREPGATTARVFRTDVLQPVVVTRITVFAVFVALLASLAISVYAVRVAREVRLQTSSRVTAANPGRGIGTVRGARTNPKILPVFSEAELRWAK